MDRPRRPRLERSCATDWIRVAPPAAGIERMEAFFAGAAFGAHRHDTYAIGFTLRGVQAFRYRGSATHSLAGQVFVLHPDETHDGHAGTESGFHYRIAYIAPRLIGEALGERRTLPFMRDPVSHNRALAAALLPALDDLERPLDPLARDQVVVEVADALAVASSAPRTLSSRHWRAVTAARALLDDNLRVGVTSAALEAATGLSRYELTRQFRACLGTSPYRYLTMRRLDRARALIRRGAPLADAAAATGFADQSHMTRKFKRAYGLSPGRWAALTA